MQYGDYEVRQTSITSFDNTRKVKKADKEKTFIPLVQKKEPDDDKVQGFYVESSDDKEAKIATTAATTAAADDDDDDDKATDSVTPADNDDDNKTVEEPSDTDALKDDDSDIMDHEVDPSVRIHTNQSIAKHNGAANPIMNALNDAVYQDVEDGDETGKAYVNAMEMLKDNNAENDPLTDVNTDNKVSLYGKVVGEVSGYTLINDTKQKITSHTEKVDFGLTWGKKSKSGAETKTMFYGSYVRNKDVLKLYTNGESEPVQNEQDIATTDEQEPANTDETLNDGTNTEDNQTQPTSIEEVSRDFKLFAAAKHKFKNKDELTAAATFYKDTSTASTTNIKTKYNSHKYNAYAQADVTIYKGITETEETSERKNTVVTNLKVGFNPEAEEGIDDYNAIMSNKDQQEENPVTDNQSTDNNTELAETKVETEAKTETDENPSTSNTNDTITPEEDTKTPAQTDNKKWSNIKNPYLITRTIAGEPSTGLGFEQYFKRKTDDSRLTLGYFAQGSITYSNDEKGNKKQDYNLAFGGNLKHIKRFNNGILESKIKIRDKYIFGKSNIFTVSGSAEYTTPKINAEVNLEYIKVPASEYIGIDARAYYNISKKIGAFIDANYIHLKETDMIKGTTIQAGVIINM